MLHRRTRRSVVVSLLAGVGLLSTVLVSTAAPASAAPYAITAVSLDAGPLTVTGLLGTATAHVSVTVESTPGVGICPMETGVPQSGHVAVRLDRAGGGPDSSVTVTLDLAEGTTTSGRWAGQWRVGAGRGGTWQVARVTWCNGTDGPDDGFSADPRVTPGYQGTLTVVATAPPRVTLTRIPTIAAYGAAQRERVTYTNASGTPLAGRRVAYGEDTSCGFSGEGGRTVTLDSRGSVTLPIGPFQQCLYLTEPQSARVLPTTTVIRRDTLSGRWWYRTVAARAATPSFVVGQYARVATTVYPRTGTASLQVLVGRTWRTIDSKTVPNTAMSLHVPATVRASIVTGRHLYRVQAALAAGQGDWLATTTSPTFVMIGT